MNSHAWASCLEAIRVGDWVRRIGRVTQVNGLVIEAEGPDTVIGDLCRIAAREGRGSCRAEVVGFRNGRTLLMSFGDNRGVGLGDEVVAVGAAEGVPAGLCLLGRVLDGLGQPIDGRPLEQMQETATLRRDPHNPLSRQSIDEVLETGVKAIDTLLTLGRGQRVGIFSGSGVGKSSLLGMIARNVRSDVSVIALVGERGREVRDFIDKSLGPEGLQRSVIVAATSDQHPLVRIHAAHTATAIAEYFRDQGQHVTLIMDSLTRFAMAQREVGLSVGEPPTARGYTPSVFTLLPKLLERAGRFEHGGTISGIYTVLVEGDDFHDPIADHVRAIVDGHIVLSRELANHGTYPAIDLLHSRSRLANVLQTSEERACVTRALGLLSTYERNRDMVEIGTYRQGQSPALDEAVRLFPEVQRFLCQDLSDAFSRHEAMAMLRKLLPEGGAR